MSGPSTLTASGPLYLLSVFTCNVLAWIHMTQVLALFKCLLKFCLTTLGILREYPIYFFALISALSIFCLIFAIQHVIYLLICLSIDGRSLPTFQVELKPHENKGFLLLFRYSELLEQQRAHFIFGERTNEGKDYQNRTHRIGIRGNQGYIHFALVKKWDLGHQIRNMRSPNS